MSLRVSLPQCMVAALSAAMIVAVPVSAGTARDVDSNHAGEQLDVMPAAPDFTLCGFDGATHHLAEYVDSIPTLVWFTNLCAGCQANIPTLDSIYRTEIEPQAALLAISLLDEDRKTVDEVSRRLGFGFPILMDPGGKTCEDYVGGYIPATCPAVNMFVVDRDRTIRLETHYPGKPLTEVLLLLKKLRGSEESGQKEKDVESGG